MWHPALPFHAHAKARHPLVVPLTAAVHVDSPEEIEARLNAEIQGAKGGRFCSARGCEAETGIDCSYLDRRDRQCPTAWCPEHRKVVKQKVYCPSHASYMTGTASEFGVHVHPDVENRVPALVNWVTREVDDDMIGIIEPLLAVYSDRMVIDPIRFVLFGVERTKTWERAWKMCSHIGMDLRVAVAVEEGRPDTILAKVNSRIIAAAPAPWNEEYPYGKEPASQEQAELEKQAMRRSLIEGIKAAVAAWTASEPPSNYGGLAAHSAEAVQEVYKIASPAPRPPSTALPGVVAPSQAPVPPGGASPRPSQPGENSQSNGGQSAG